MAHTQAVTSGNPKNDSGVVLHGGTVASSRWIGKTILTALADEDANPYRVIQAGGTAGQSGNLGTFKPLTGRFANQQIAGNYVAVYLLDTIAGVATTVLNNSARSRFIPPRWQGYQRYNITSWNAATGAASFGSDRGVTVSPSGINGTVGPQADDAVAAIPAELSYMYGGPNPLQDEYKLPTES